VKWLASFEIDHRIIYVVLFVALALPLLMPLGLPLTPQSEARQAFERVEQLKDGGRVLFSIDYSTGSVSELEPGAAAILTHLLRKQIKVVAVTSTDQGALLAERLLERIYGAAGKQYGTDYVNLGFFGGGETGLAATTENIRGIYQKDFRGNGLDSLALMKELKDITGYEMAFSINNGPSGGASTDAWVRQVKTGHATPLVMSVAATMGPAAFPYLRGNQMDGLLVGLRGGADYEALLGYVGDARKGMDALSVAHVVIILTILLGNLALFAKARVKARSGMAVGGTAR
jgi:hypothetical protein